MTEIKEMFIDGINNINFVNGMIRMTVGTLVANEDDNSQPEFNATHRIIMPLNSFLAGVNSQNQLVEKLEANKIISRNNNTETSEVVPEVVS